MPAKRSWGLILGASLIGLSLLSIPFLYVWTMRAFYPSPAESGDAFDKPWKPFARLALSSFLVVASLVLGALLIRIEFRDRRP